MTKQSLGIAAMICIALFGFSLAEAVTFTLLEPVGVSPVGKSQPYSKGDEFRIDIQVDASDLPQGVLVNGASLCLTIKESKIAPKNPSVPFTDGPYLPVQPTSNTITGDKIIFSELALGTGGSGVGILASITFVVTADTPTSPDTVLWCGLNPNDQLRTDFSRSDQPGSITPTVVPDAGRDVSLPVELSVFTALSTDRGMILKWRTATETNNLGFNVYRSETPDGTFGKLNPVLIKGAGTDATPRDYQFVDESIQPGKVYYYYLEDVDFKGITKKSDLLQVDLVTNQSRLQARPLMPVTTRLLQNFPNPFNPDTWIPYQLAKDAFVTLTIYDTTGAVIRTLLVGHQPAAAYESKDKAIYWDGRNDWVERVASGIYFYTLTAKDFTATRKMLILK